jgi:hypothetical protein
VSYAAALSGGLGAVADIPGPSSGSTNYTPFDYETIYGAMASGGYMPPGGERLLAESNAFHAQKLAYQRLVAAVLQKGYRVSGDWPDVSPSARSAGGGDIVNPLTGQNVGNLFAAGFSPDALPIVRAIAEVPTTSTAPPAAQSAPPPLGWKMSEGGWWGPDGLFYKGTTPWLTGVVGVSLATPAARAAAAVAARPATPPARATPPPPPPENLPLATTTQPPASDMTSTPPAQPRTAPVVRPRDQSVTWPGGPPTGDPIDVTTPLAASAGPSIPPVALLVLAAGALFLFAVPKKRR